MKLCTEYFRELGGDFSPECFAHEARWNEAESAIEMHLVSLREQMVAIDGRRFAFEAGETIHTESSRKYSVHSFMKIVEDGRRSESLQIALTPQRPSSTFFMKLCTEYFRELSV